MNYRVFCSNCLSGHRIMVQQALMHEFSLVAMGLWSLIPTCLKKQ